MNRTRTYILSLPLLFSLWGSAQSVDFTFESLSGSYCAPSRVRFHSIVSGSPQGFVWIFGTIGSSNNNDPVFLFNTPGTFQVKMIAIYKKKAITITKDITIHPGVNPGLTLSRNKLCTPGQVEFTVNSGPGETFLWNFGDNSSPVSTTATTITHHYTQYGNYNVMLKSTATTGCIGESSDSVNIQRPAISGTVTPENGCTPALANFQSSIDLPQGSVVNQYQWDFGDGQNLSGNNASASHAYTLPGSYFPTLHISTTDGCSNQFQFSPLAFGTPPVNIVAHPSLTTFCGSAAPAFYAYATNANRYFWDFGQQDTLSVTDTVIYHKFQHVGLTTVTVTPYFNNCPGPSTSFQVNVIGVISRFDYHNTCSDKKSFQFNNISEGNQSSHIWEIGSNVQNTQDDEIEHQFPATGTVPVSLHITDSITGCSDISSTNIYTANPELKNPDRSICKGTTTHFVVDHNYANPNLSFAWQVIGLQAGPGLTANPFSILASQHGHFTQNLVIINNGVHYCLDTVSLHEEILVRGPVLDFDVHTNFCANIPCLITNNSHPYIANDHILHWNWNYGPPVDEARDTNYTPHPFTYNIYWGTNNVSLSATDNQGCTDSLTKPVVVYRVPFLKKIPDVDSLCAGNTATLIAFHSDPITWTANGSLPCTTCDTLVVQPLHTTWYKVHSVNQWQCESKDSVQIVVFEPFTASAAKNNISVCMGESVKLEINPTDKIITWLPGGQIPDGNFSPTIHPEHSQSYTAILSDSAGCFSSRTAVRVNVKPLPAVEAGPNRIVPFHSSITLSPAYSTDVVNFLWTPANGLSCTNCAAPSCQVNEMETYTISVVSDSGCVASDKITVMVECANSNIYIPTAFTPNRDGLNDLLHPIARGIKEITHFTIYDRLGVKMYEINNRQASDKSWGWDGTYRGINQPQTTYIYVFQAICDAGETISSKGSFILLR